MATAGGHIERPLRLTVRELRGQLIVLATVLWGFAIVNASTSTQQLRSGQIKGTDFVQFYTLAHLAADGRVAQFADSNALREIQLSVVPGSGSMYFPPLYGPQVALAL